MTIIAVCIWHVYTARAVFCAIFFRQFAYGSDINNVSTKEYNNSSARTVASSCWYAFCLWKWINCRLCQMCFTQSLVSMRTNLILIRYRISISRTKLTLQFISPWATTITMKCDNLNDELINPHKIYIITFMIFNVMLSYLF